MGTTVGGVMRNVPCIVKVIIKADKDLSVGHQMTQFKTEPTDVVKNDT